MSGETETNVSGWTTDTLKAYLETRLGALNALLDERDHRYDQRFEAQEDANRAALTSAKEAVQKAETASEKRFDSVNEFRLQLSDQTKTYIPRAEAETLVNALAERYDTGHTALVEKVNEIAARVERQEGRGGGYAASGALILTVASILATVGIGILVIVTRH